MNDIVKNEREFLLKREFRKNRIKENPQPEEREY